MPCNALIVGLHLKMRISWHYAIMGRKIQIFAWTFLKKYSILVENDFLDKKPMQIQQSDGVKIRLLNGTGVLKRICRKIKNSRLGRSETGIFK